MAYTVINRDQLNTYGATAEFQGIQFGGPDLSFILVDVGPGEGPRLHLHPYAEVFIIQEGRATFTVGDESVEGHAGQILIVPPETPHKFVNSGDGRLRQVDIHSSKQFVTTWLED